MLARNEGCQGSSIPSWWILQSISVFFGTVGRERGRLKYEHVTFFNGILTCVSMRLLFQEVLELAFSILYDSNGQLNFIAPDKHEVSHRPNKGKWKWGYFLYKHCKHFWGRGHVSHDTKDFLPTPSPPLFSLYWRSSCLLRTPSPPFLEKQELLFHKYWRAINSHKWTQSKNFLWYI